MNENIDKKFKKINKELSERNDLVELFIESWKKLSEDNDKIQEFLGVKIKEIFGLDYSEFTITIGKGEICITMWTHINGEDIEKFDSLIGKQSKIIGDDEFIYLKYDFVKYY